MSSSSVTLPKDIAPEKRSKLSWAVRDSLVLIKRSATHILRNPDQLLAAVFQPIMFLVLFRYVFGGSIDTGPVSYINFLIAGILVQTLAFGATTTAIGVANDMQRGIIDRFRSLPMVSSAVLTGHVVSDLARNAISIVVMVLVGLLVGFRPDASPIEWLLAIVIMLLFTLAISWLSAILGLLAKSVEAVQWFSFIAIFPLTFASSAFAPTDKMVTPLRVFAENQPVTQVVNAVRSLLVGTPENGSVGWAIFWCLALLIVSYAVATWLFARKAAQ